jgi:hypothetical protein
MFKSTLEKLPETSLLQDFPSTKQVRRSLSPTAAFQSREPTGEPGFDFISPGWCEPTIALRSSQLGDGVGGQFGGAPRLFRPVLEVDRELFRGLDGGFERNLRVFLGNG